MLVLEVDGAVGGGGGDGVGVGDVVRVGAQPGGGEGKRREDGGVEGVVVRVGGGVQVAVGEGEEGEEELGGRLWV